MKSRKVVLLEEVRNFNNASCLIGDEPDIGGPCPVSRYCPEGTSFPLGCPSGTYNNLTGQWNCTECPAGFYCNENTTSYETFPCPTGYYCPNGTRHANEYPCPKGTYRDTMMGQSVSDCLPCTAGSYCGTQGLSAVSGQCSAGKTDDDDDKACVEDDNYDNYDSNSQHCIALISLKDESY